METSLPLVSVRIPVYNHGTYVENCLNSALKDEYPKKELVIIDDGSTDNSPEIIQKWIHSNYTKIKTTFIVRSHRGLTQTLNELISLCNGDYLVSLASDDMLIENGISSRVAYLNSRKDKLAVFGDCTVIDKNDRQIYESGIFNFHGAQKEKYLSEETLKEQIIYHWSIPGSVLMVKKEIFSVLGNYNKNLSVEDWDFYLRMVSRDLVGFVDKKVAAYRVHDQSTCRGFGKEKIVQFELLKTAFRNLPLFKGSERRLLAKKAGVIIFLLIKNFFKNSI